MSFSIEVHGQLTAEEVAEIKQLTFAAITHDDLAPLSEHVLIHLNHGGDEADEHIVARNGDGQVVGYLHLDQTDVVSGPVVESVVHPDFRRQGIGTALVRAAEARTETSRLRLWAHGELASAYELAHKLGYLKARELWQMRRSLFAPLPKAELPADISIRNFVIGQDENAWITLNAEVFAEHPEQGSWTIDDLKVRMAEAWFDPEGFLLASRVVDGKEKLVGFHWTKIHGGQKRSDSGAHDHREIGEIYVLGVAPSERGTGLSRALTVRGLDYLRRQGLSAAMLYVDSDNTHAKSLYESLGFSHWDTDVMFTHEQVLQS